MSKVPRWGAMSFEEKIENDMVLNRMKVTDNTKCPNQKNFLKINIKQANTTATANLNQGD